MLSPFFGAISLKSRKVDINKVLSSIFVKCLFDGPGISILFLITTVREQQRNEHEMGTKQKWIENETLTNH